MKNQFVMALLCLMAAGTGVSAQEKGVLNCYSASAFYGAYVRQYLGINQSSARLITHQSDKNDPTKMVLESDEERSFKVIGKDVYQADYQQTAEGFTKMTIKIVDESQPWDQKITAIISVVHPALTPSEVKATCEYK